MAFWKKFYKSKYTGAEIDAAVAKAGDATKVTANPTLAGTEAALTGLEVGTTKYKVEQPINVVANPTLAGTEAALAGLQVGNTKYKVEGGGLDSVNFPAFPGATGIGILTFIGSATTSLKSKSFDVSGAVADYIETFGGFDQGEIFTVNYPDAQLNSSLGIIASKNPDDNSFIVSSTVTWADTNQVIYKLDIDLYVDLNSATLTLGVVKSTVAT